MEMRPVDKSVYSFVTREGEGEGGSAFKINEGIFKGTIYKYSHITLPKEDAGHLRLSFQYDILDYGGNEKEKYKKDWIKLIGDILADQIDERIGSDALVFNEENKV
jgi:hypothetical protein